MKVFEDRSIHIPPKFYLVEQAETTSSFESTLCCSRAPMRSSVNSRNYHRNVIVLFLIMDEDLRTIWCGNLSDQVTEDILYELFLQGGPVQRVSIPVDQNGKQRMFGFITYKHINSVAYALNLFQGTVLFNRTINVSTKTSTKLPQIEKPQEHSRNYSHMLQSGQQILLANDAVRMKIDTCEMNMFPKVGSTFKQVDSYPYKDDRKSRRAHPYQRNQSRNSSHYQDHRSNVNHNNHRSNDYSRHNYKSSRRNYH